MCTLRSQVGGAELQLGAELNSAPWRSKESRIAHLK